MRVVLDTNVLVSGLLWRGPPHELIQQARSGRMTIVSSTDLLVEFGAVIRRRKFRPALGRSRTDVDRLLREVRHLVEIVRLTPALEVISRDPDDDVVLAVAVAARADLIVSGDIDLLILRSYRGIPIVDPASALAQIV